MEWAPRYTIVYQEYLITRSAISLSKESVQIIDMSLPCSNIVGWSKRGLAQETQLLGSSSITRPETDTLDLHSSSPFIRLPGELRNRILEYCVQEATFCPRCLEHHKIVADVSRNMQIRGIGSLPVLFVNKQIHDEAISLVYSRLEPVAINGYFLTFHQSQTSFLPSSYPAIWPHHPHVQSSARSVSITMSYWKAWGEGLGSWCDFTSDQRSLAGPHSGINAMTPFETHRSVIRKLAKYLRTFKSLSQLEIIINLRRHPEGNDSIHGLRQLLPLYDLHVPSTAVKFQLQVDLRRDRSVGVEPSAGFREQSHELVLEWMQAWKECLLCSGRQAPDFESGVEEWEHDSLRYVVVSQTTFLGSFQQ